jgi:hypothetical protein
MGELHVSQILTLTSLAPTLMLMGAYSTPMVGVMLRCEMDLPTT